MHDALLVPDNSAPPVPPHNRFPASARLMAAGVFGLAIAAATTWHRYQPASPEDVADFARGVAAAPWDSCKVDGDHLRWYQAKTHPQAMIGDLKTMRRTLTRGDLLVATGVVEDCYETAPVRAKQRAAADAAVGAALTPPAGSPPA